MLHRYIVRFSILAVYGAVLYAFIFNILSGSYFYLGGSPVILAMMLIGLGLGISGQFIFDWKRTATFKHVYLNTFYVVGALCVILFFIQEETVACIVISLPVIAVLQALRILGIRALQQALGDNAIMSVWLMLVPLMTVPLSQADLFPYRSETVVSEVIIDADPMTVWNTIHDVTVTADADLPWTITHNILRTPTPISAETIGNKRVSRWTEGVMFEEHFTEVVAGQTLAWDFAFPQPELLHALDYSLSPTGPEVYLLSGRYDLTALPDGRTKVQLSTTYGLRTAINPYFAAWGTLLMTDMHKAILAVIEQGIT